jgi:anti-sigma regulatory factor (Ser/Thr protein kinase)
MKKSPFVISMSAHSTEISLSARPDELPRLMALISGIADQLALCQDRFLKLQLVLEELFVNTFTHGTRQCTDVNIHIRIAREQSDVLVHYSDDGQMFDTAGLCGDPSALDGIGGLGMTLIRGVCKSIEYAHINRHNVTQVRL